jgi:hypothetical protein
MPWSGAHGGETVRGSTAEQVEEDGLCLVVGRMTRCSSGRQSAEPGRARPCLEIRPLSDAYPVDDDLDTEGGGNLVHDMYVLVGALAQTVVDMMGDDVAVGGDR